MISMHYNDWDSILFVFCGGQKHLNPMACQHPKIFLMVTEWGMKEAVK